mmetsp:Transcript_8065/g.23179  ORF Transcript_8065/g.23179 Transcript_8065/m.23179 type:complete len:217 (+) Transcript_8065:1104-1754(+)
MPTVTGVMDTILHHQRRKHGHRHRLQVVGKNLNMFLVIPLAVQLQRPRLLLQMQIPLWEKHPKKVLLHRKEKGTMTSLLATPLLLPPSRRDKIIVLQPRHHSPPRLLSPRQQRQNGTGNPRQASETRMINHLPSLRPLPPLQKTPKANPLKNGSADTKPINGNVDTLSWLNSMRSTAIVWWPDQSTTIPRSCQSWRTGSSGSDSNSKGNYKGTTAR